MMAFKNKSMLLAASLLSGVVFYSNSAVAYTITADEIYRQARQKNYGFFQRLARYNGAVNMQNRSGDTAYCVALRYNDISAQEMLLNYGAKDNHPCVEKVAEEKKQYARQQAEMQKARSRSLKWEDDTGNNYLWWGLGALAVGGGVAALASGGGSGGSHSGSSGDGGESNFPENPIREPTIDANVFRTAEYNNSNYLEGIKAADAYSYMYTQDENGDLVSHQADSDDALKKVKVGVIDTGVYANKDLDGKIVGSYDINP